MKKRKFVCLCLSILTLAACGQGKQETTTKPSSTQPSQNQTSKQSDKKKMTDRKFYETILTNYRTAITDTSANLADLGVNTLVASAKLYPQVYKGISYTYTDLDKNGIEEFILAFEMVGGDYMPIDYYTLDGDKPVRLSQGSGQLDMIGERMTLLPLADGKLLYSGSAGYDKRGYSLYQFAENGLSFEKVSDGGSKEELTDAELLDLNQLKWTSLQGDEKIASSQQDENKIQASSGMDLAALQNGDFSSVVGTWKDGKGNTLVFEEGGRFTINGHPQVYKDSVPESSETVGINIGSEGSWGGAIMKFAKAGTSFMFGQAEDVSDKSKERIWAGQGYSKDPAEFYYKVE